MPVQPKLDFIEVYGMKEINFIEIYIVEKITSSKTLKEFVQYKKLCQICFKEFYHIILGLKKLIYPLAWGMRLLS